MFLALLYLPNEAANSFDPLILVLIMTFSMLDYLENADYVKFKHKIIKFNIINGG